MSLPTPFSIVSDPIAPSSRRSLLIEAIGDVAKALHNIMEEAFPDFPIRTIEINPRLVDGEVGTVSLICHTFTNSVGQYVFPPNLEAVRQSVMESLYLGLPKTFPTIPMQIYKCDPPEFPDGFGVMVKCVDQLTPEEARYPRFVTAKIAWLRPSNFLRQKLGLPIDE